MKHNQKIQLIILFVFLQYLSFSQKKTVAQIRTCTLLSDTVIRWTAKEDTSKFTYYIQQFKWNRWVTFDSIKSLNQKDSAKYSYKVAKYLHTGKNQFRIKTKDITPKFVMSNKVFFDIKEAQLFKSTRHFSYYKKNPIHFTQETFYELYDKNGKMLKSGFGKSFFIYDLSSDVYYLNYDNKTLKIIP